jgi:peptide/nickel transport system permease protein
MASYVVRRILIALGLLLVLTLATFLLFNAVPTDPARLTCGKSCTPTIIAANRIRLGLNQPLIVQYWEFLRGIFMGRTFGSGTAQFDCAAPCLGYSFRSGDTVLHLIGQAAPVTLSLAVGAFVLWMVIGVATGVYAALHRGKLGDRVVTGLALVGYSLPVFFIGLLLLVFVVIRWQFLPYPSYAPLTTNPLQWFQSLLLPWIAVATVYAAFYTRLVRSEVLDVMNQDYVRTARALGVSPRRLLWRHILRACVNPILTAAGLDFAGLLGGAVITEAVFNLPGLGRLAVSAVTDYDLPLVTGTTLVAAVAVLVGNLGVDLAYGALDPRIRSRS